MGEPSGNNSSKPRSTQNRDGSRVLGFRSTQLVHRANRLQDSFLSMHNSQLEEAIVDALHDGVAIVRDQIVNQRA